jgi:hypothetical protein
MDKGLKSANSFDWSTKVSYQTYLGLCRMETSITDLQSNLVQNYLLLKRPFYRDMGSELAIFASGELEFPKDRDEDIFLDPLTLKIGMKAGITFGCISIYLLKAYLLVNLETVYDHPGIYIFGAYAAYLLYRLLWLLNVSIFDRHCVNYIHFFKFNIMRAQTFRILNEILSEVLLFAILYIVFAESLTQYGILYGTVINPGSPQFYLY